MMQRLSFTFVALAAAGMASAQTHVVKKPETVVRAIGVYEWTGDEAKPTASRLVPVSIFINSQLEDAGIYMARPVPFALDRGTVFEAELAGRPEGTLELGYQRHLERSGDGTAATPFDDGWLGYGPFKPVVKAPVQAIAAKKTGPLPQVVASGGSKPHFGNKDDDAKPSDSGKTDAGKMDAGKTDAGKTDPKAAQDPDKPVLVRRDDSGDAATADTTSSAGKDSGTREDATRPTMRRRTSDPTDTAGADPGDDVDRPTLKKRTPQQAKDAKKKGELASVRSASELNDDPDRPTLHRGTATAEAVQPLNGLPKDMRQLVAVSDAKDREVHDFSRPWDDDRERAAVLGRMQEIARARLATYEAPGPKPAGTPAPPPAVKSAAKGAAKPGSRTKKPPSSVAVSAPPMVLAEEQLRGYTLSYGGAATFVYTASSPGVGGATRYVSVVAQQESAGDLKAALVSVTDSAHLDRTPWMRLVDVVDAEASNRASLLFEMRAQSARQFALYSVIGAKAEQIFETGTTQ